MSIHVSVDSLVYSTTDESHVQVRVMIGDAQGGGWVVCWDADNIIQKGSDSVPVSIGVGKDIRNKVLQIIATVVDIRPETNRLSSTATISGGVGGPKTLVHTHDDGAEGDSAIFTTMVQFQ
jgi:hypothetical protein